MSRGPCTFKQRDVTQALKAAKAAGCNVSRVEIDRLGTIVLVTSVHETAPEIRKLNSWEDVK